MFTALSFVLLVHYRQDHHSTHHYHMMNFYWLFKCTIEIQILKLLFSMCKIMFLQRPKWSIYKSVSIQYQKYKLEKQKQNKNYRVQQFICHIISSLYAHGKQCLDQDITWYLDSENKSLFIAGLSDWRKRHYKNTGLQMWIMWSLGTYNFKRACFIHETYGIIMKAFL